MAQKNFTFASFLVRWLVAVVMVFATFNPTQYSYFNWIAQMTPDDLPLKVLGGVVLAILYVIFIRATLRSIGPIGIALVLALFAAVIWVLFDYGLLDPSRATVLTYLALLILATVLAIGMSWSHVRRRMAGQADVDDVDE